MDAKKRLPEIKFKCKTCGHVPKPDKKQSNENWKVYPGICPKCGGQIGFDTSEFEVK